MKTIRITADSGDQFWIDPTPDGSVAITAVSDDGLLALETVLDANTVTALQQGLRAALFSALDLKHAARRVAS